MNQKEVSRNAKRLSPKVSSEVIDAIGGTGTVSRLCDISSSAVTQWRINGMPKSRVLYLRELFKKLPVMQVPEVRNL